jgi:predicted RNase H-like nuclease (RuvC/YqgF family)
MSTDPAKSKPLAAPTPLPGSEIPSLRKALQASESELRALKKSAAASAELAELRRERIEKLETRIKGMGIHGAEIAMRDEHIAVLEEHVRQSDHQLHLLRRSFVVRAWNRLRRIPPLSWIAARRDRARGR